jgi:hypothetical protein
MWQQGIVMEGKGIIISKGIKVMIWVVGIPLIHPIGGALKGWAIPRGILIHLILCNGIGLFAL